MTAFCRFRSFLFERRRPGISVLELIVAMGIFTIVTSGAVVLALGAYTSSLRDENQLVVDMYLQQGVEAVRSMRSYDPNSLTATGVYGLRRTNGYFEFFGAQETLGRFTRTVQVELLSRAPNCDIVSSGGIGDPNSRKVTVTLEWQRALGVTASASVVEYVQAWRKNVGPGCGQGSYLLIDASNAALDLGAANKQVDDLLFSNLADSPLTITKVLPTWTNGAKVEEINMNDALLWKFSNTGTPTGKQNSGVELDVVDYVFPANTPQPDHNRKIIRLDTPMTGQTFTFLYTMSDGSTAFIEFSP